MPILLQIDSCLGILSTGRISESIGLLALKNGWDCYIAHGARYVGKSQMKTIQVVTKTGEYLHYAQSLLLDRHGLGSIYETKKLIEKIEEIKPDVIQLHCIHGYYLNYKVLFEYFNNNHIPVVWTFHDCWAFTGHCVHFITANCFKWKNEGCHDCSLKGRYPRSLIDRAKRNFRLKKTLFAGNQNLHIVVVSSWLSSFVKDSFLKDKDIRVINNGIDISRFNICAEKSEKPIILGVASSWSEEKGLLDFYELRKELPQNLYDIILVGLSEEQINELPEGIKGISRTSSVEILAKMYSEAFVFVNPTYSDSFPTVNMEALACGTPVITYRTGGSPEIIDEKTGIVIEQGDIDALIKAIKQMKEYPLSSADCRNRAEIYYNKDDRFIEYINLYEQLIDNRHYID
ncbi:glycosyltransferase [Parabacteroides sp.]